MHLVTVLSFVILHHVDHIYHIDQVATSDLSKYYILVMSTYTIKVLFKVSLSCPKIVKYSVRSYNKHKILT